MRTRRRPGRKRRRNKKTGRARSAEKENRYEVTVSRNLFKSRPWEKQTNNQSNCKMEFPASEEAGSVLLQSLPLLSPSLLFFNPQITIRSRKKLKRRRREFLCGRNGPFSRGIVRGGVNKVRLWSRNIRRFGKHGDRVVLPLKLLSRVVVSSNVNFVISPCSRYINHRDITFLFVCLFAALLRERDLAFCIAAECKSTLTSSTLELHSSSPHKQIHTKWY